MNNFNGEAPEKQNAVTAYIPTIGSPQLPLCLMSLYNEECIDEIVIFDSGDIPSISMESVRLAIDALFFSGKKVSVFRRDREGIGKARYHILEDSIARSKYTLMMDDDVLYPQGFVGNNEQGIKEASFIVPRCSIAVDYLKNHNMDLPPISVHEEIKELRNSGVVNGDWMLPYLSYTGCLVDKRISISCAGTQCILINNSNIKREKLMPLALWKKDANREDIYITEFVIEGDGYLCTKHESVHIPEPSTRLNWSKQDEDVGYATILKGEIEQYII